MSQSTGLVPEMSVSSSSTDDVKVPDVNKAVNESWIARLLSRGDWLSIGTGDVSTYQLMSATRNAGYVHLINSAVLFVLAITTKVHAIPITLEYVRHRSEPAVPLHLFSINVAWMSFVFSFLAGARLLYSGTLGLLDYTKSLAEQGTNPFRWMEYAITAPMMSVMIGALSGIYDFKMLLSLFVITAVVIILGAHYENNDDHMAFYLSGGLFFFVWLMIYVQFGVLAVHAHGGVPAFVYAINIVVIIAELGFPIVYGYKKIEYYTPNQAEFAYLMLELFSKIYLAWVAYGGSVTF